VIKQQRIVKKSVREHIFVLVFFFAAKGDVKLQNQLEKEVDFYTFCIQADLTH